MSDTDVFVQRIQEVGKNAPWWFWLIFDLLIVLVKCLLSAFVAGAIVFLTSTQTVTWASLDPFAQKCIWLGAAIACAKDILSFLSTAASDMKKRGQAQPTIEPETKVG